MPDFMSWAAGCSVSVDVDEHLNALASSKADASEEDIALLLRRMDREAAAETGAVEGLYDLATGATRTIADEREGWEAALSHPNGIASFDAQLTAYEMVREMVNRAEPITEVAIRELHKVACHSQGTYDALVNDGLSVRVEKRPLTKGHYKTQPNSRRVRDGAEILFASVAETPHEMQHLIRQISGANFDDAHPIIKSAYVHHALSVIHPFTDGNGRVIRARSSYYTYQLCDLPMIVYADRRQGYFQALEAADQGKPQALVNYLSDRLIDTASRAMQEIESRMRPSSISRLQQLRSIIAVRSELTIQSANKVAGEVLSAVLTRLESQLARQFADTEVKARPNKELRGVFVHPLPKGYGQPIGRYFVLEVEKPVELSEEFFVGVALATDLADRFPFRIMARRGDNLSSVLSNEVPLRYEDVYPTVGEAANSRIELLIEGALSSTLAELTAELRKVLRQLGFDDV